MGKQIGGGSCTKFHKGFGLNRAVSQSGPRQMSGYATSSHSPCGSRRRGRPGAGRDRFLAGGSSGLHFRIGRWDNQPSGKSAEVV